MSEGTGATGRDDSPPRESLQGILGSLKALLDTALGIVHNRTELVATDLRKELARLVRVVVWALATVLSATVGAAFVGAMILNAVDPERRVLVAGILGLLFLGFAGFGYLAVRRTLRGMTRPFDASLRALEKDRDHLRSRR